MIQERYSGFSQIYDIFMDDIPYDKWCGQTLRILHEYGIDSGIVADLGCGTGAMTQRLAACGYDMIGVDVSYEMLQEALEKREESRQDILYLCQDMREFELYGTCAAFISRCDSINYLTSVEDLTRVLALVNNYLDPGGVFVFDCNTQYKYMNIPDVIAENREEGSFIWENAYDPKTRINEYDLTLYIREDGCGGQETYRRYEETHMQRAFTIDEIREAAETAGLIWETVCDADDEGEVRDTTQRLLITLREHGKNV